MSRSISIRKVCEDKKPTPKVPVTGEALALELVNTTFIDGGLRGHLVDVLATPVQLENWVIGHSQQFSSELLTLLPKMVYNQHALDKFLELRTVLRACFTAVASGNPPAIDEVEAINRFIRDGAFYLELSLGDPIRVIRHWSTDDPLTNALGEIATNAGELLMPSRIGKLKACPAPGCILFFEKGHPRREWCSPACGNRVRVARHSKMAKKRDA